MATVILNKEMVDLATKIKRHLRDRYQINITLADPMLIDKLTELRSVNDPLLQGMLKYLMAMAGEEWVRKYNGEGGHPPPESRDSRGLKRLFEVYRGKALRDPAEEELGDPESRKSKSRSTLYRGKPPGDDTPPVTGQHQPDKATVDDQPKARKIIRYYRGAPVYEE
jgi:hypothetical protein